MRNIYLSFVAVFVSALSIVSSAGTTEILISGIYAQPDNEAYCAQIVVVDAANADTLYVSDVVPVAAREPSGDLIYAKGCKTSTHKMVRQASTNTFLEDPSSASSTGYRNTMTVKSDASYSFEGHDNVLFRGIKEEGIVKGN